MSDIFGGLSILTSLVSATSNINSQTNTILGNIQRRQEQADQAIAIGEDKVSELLRKGRRVLGQQKTAFAGSNIDLGSGTATAVEIDTLEELERQSDRIRLNAKRQALGYEFESDELIKDISDVKNTQLSKLANTLITTSFKDRGTK